MSCSSTFVCADDARDLVSLAQACPPFPCPVAGCVCIPHPPSLGPIVVCAISPVLDMSPYLRPAFCELACSSLLLKVLSCHPLILPPTCHALLGCVGLSHTDIHTEICYADTVFPRERNLFMILSPPLADSMEARLRAPLTDVTQTQKLIQKHQHEEASKANSNKPSECLVTLACCLS